MLSELRAPTRLPPPRQQRQVAGHVDAAGGHVLQEGDPLPQVHLAVRLQALDLKRNSGSPLIKFVKDKPRSNYAFSYTLSTQLAGHHQPHLQDQYFARGGGDGEDVCTLVLLLVLQRDGAVGDVDLRGC